MKKHHNKSHLKKKSNLNNHRDDTMFTKNNLVYRYVETPENILNDLPNQIYTLDFDKETGFSLKLIADKFRLPEKIYSHKNETAIFNLSDIFISDFKRRDSNLGVLLNGIKGTGKSLLFKQLANNVLLRGMPVILVQEKFSSTMLSKYLSELKQEAMIVFDEFDKLYSLSEEVYNSQNDLLSFFDGTTLNKKLIILTSNDESKLSEFLINRPGRIKYMINFKALSFEFVTNFLKEKLTNKLILEDVANHLIEIDELNFDMLKTAVEEVNLLSDVYMVKDIFSILNIKVANIDYDAYSIEVFLNGTFIEKFVNNVNFDSLEKGTQTVYPPRKLVKLIADIKLENKKPSNDRLEVSVDTNIELSYDKIDFIRGKNQFIYIEEDYLGTGVLKLIFTRLRKKP